MVRYLDDYERQCRRCKGGCAIEGMSGSIVCTGFNAMTNADRIRNMTDKELAELLHSQFVFSNSYLPSEWWLEWLKQEHEE